MTSPLERLAGPGESLRVEPFDSKECAGLVLRRHGYRAENRYIVFQVLPHTLGLGPEVWRVLAKCHQIRNQGEYEGDLSVDERLVADLISACKAVSEALAALPPLDPAAD